VSKYNAFNAPLFSIFDPGLYREVRYKWEGTNLFYLLGLILCILIVSATAWFICMNRVVEQAAPKIVNNLPVMTFDNGELSIDKDSPYFIYEQFAGTTPVASSIALMKFDTSRDISSLEGGDTLILFSKKTLVLPMMTMSYQGFGNSKLLPATVDGMLRMSTFVIPVLYVLIGLPFLWTLHAMQAILYAGVAVVLAQMSASKLPFDAAMRLALIAMTPVMLLSTVFTIMQTAMGTRMPYLEHWGFLTVPIVIGYLVFAVRSSSQGEPAS
jgi:hypothetical protein